MKHTSLNEGKIGNSLSRFAFLDKIKVIKTRPSLFPQEADFSQVRAGNCAYCGKKFKVMRNGNIYCNRKKCPAFPKFFMTKEKYEKLSPTKLK